MRWWLVVCVIASGCVASDAVVCGDGTTCPVGTECRALSNPAEQICATRVEIAACAGKAEADDCAVEDVALARCYDGVCLAAGCGNGRIDPEEVCDDRNNESADGCAAGCLSDETCGNGVVDLVGNETCDDRNDLDQDGCTSACRLEELSWSELTVTPPARFSGAAAYDPLRNRVVMFGGQITNGDPAPGQVWEFDGATWSQFRGITPPARGFFGMAFDGRHIVLYGPLDTWVFNGDSWRPVFGATTPGFRQQPSMAYDAKRDRVVLFGGEGTAAPETWEWNGATETWARVQTQTTPPKRGSAMMAFDPIRGVIVLASGQSSLGDTWVFDGTNWSDVTPSTGVVPRWSGGAMAFDSGSGRIIAYGVEQVDLTQPRPTYTYAWNGSTWTDLGLATAPLLRDSPQVASMGSRIVLMGGRWVGNGSMTLDDTWIFENGAWLEAISPGPWRSLISNDYSRGEIVVVVNDPNTLESETWLLDDRGWRQYAGATPAGTQIAYDWARKEVVLHSGAAGMTSTWNGTGWTTYSVVAALAPPPGTALAFDGTGVTSYGGIRPPFGYRSETWRWTGTAWSQLAPANLPPINAFALTAYDPVRKQMVMFGGGFLDETWTFDGTDWTKHIVLGRPPAARSDNAQLVWNPARERLALIAPGFAAWEWDGIDWASLTTANLPTQVDDLHCATAIDGSGIVLYGSVIANNTPTIEELWELRFRGPGTGERCDGTQLDLDLDGLMQCDDPDCWMSCTPDCAPGVCP